MKLLKYSHSKTFHYNNAEERLSHINEIEQDGWICSGRVKGFSGNLGSRDDVNDEGK